MVLTSDGRLGINATNITERLTVGGTIAAREVIVSVNAGADFVFNKDYQLPSLKEVESFISENHHLPDVAPANEMDELKEENNKLKAEITSLKNHK